MARVLEISRIPLFKSCLSEQTTWFSLGASLIAGDEGCVSERFTVRNLFRLFRALRDGSYDLVVLPAVDMSYGYDPHWRKRFLRRLVRAAASMKLAATLLEKLFRLRKNTVVFVDVADVTSLSYEVCALVPNFLGYFKREFDTRSTLREGERWQSVNARIIPWSLFVPSTEFAPGAAHKKNDVFFAGQVNNSVRREGAPQIRALEARGYKIDVPLERLSYREYMQRLAEAWLVWSPEGYGWDCYRHYESAFVGSVPVINTPGYPRHLPYRDGEECFLYHQQDHALEEVIARALEDKEKLRSMAARARERVLACYTRRALVARMQADTVEKLRRERRTSRLLDEWTHLAVGFSGTE